MSNNQRSNRFRLILWALLLLFQLGAPKLILAQPFTGLVVRVSDGDTLTVMHSGRGEKVRLYGIDAPEKGQDFGVRAKVFLSNEIFGKTVSVNPREKDKYGRTIGEVTFQSGEKVSQKIIKNGFAWWLKKYASKDKILERLESEAREQRLGLWSKENPIPPWDFRHRKSTKKEPAAKPLSFSSLPIIGNKNSRIYHLSTCEAYAKVSLKNRAIFKTEEEARSAGYRVAKNCN